MERIVTASLGRHLALALLGLGALASAAIAIGRTGLPPSFGYALLVTFVVALVSCARGARPGRVIGYFAVSGVGVLLMLAAVGWADPDSHQTFDRYPSDGLYLVVALAAAYWIASVAALRHIAPKTNQAPDHA